MVQVVFGSCRSGVVAPLNDDIRFQQDQIFQCQATNRGQANLVRHIVKAGNVQNVTGQRTLSGGVVVYISDRGSWAGFFLSCGQARQVCYVSGCEDCRFFFLAERLAHLFQAFRDIGERTGRRELFHSNTKIAQQANGCGRRESSGKNKVRF